MCTHSIDDLLPHAPLHCAATGEMVKGSLYYNIIYIMIDNMNLVIDIKLQSKIIHIPSEFKASIVQIKLGHYQLTDLTQAGQHTADNVVKFHTCTVAPKKNYRKHYNNYFGESV